MTCVSHVMQVLYSLQRGGSETVARDIALRLDPRRFRSSVCALDLAGPFMSEFQQAGMAAHVMGRRPGFDWALIGKLFRLFRRERVDLVQTHHLTQLIYGGLGARLAGAALVHVEHDYFSIMSRKARRRLRLLAPICHKVVAVGGAIGEFLVSKAGLAPHKVTVIRNGVDVGRYTMERRVPREAFGLSQGERVIGHVARLDPAKDQATLFRAFRKVLDLHEDTRLVIAGDGPLQAPLKALAGDLQIDKRVEFLGGRSDVADLLPHLDVFVLSSANEGLPLVVLEAMACGRPVVATAVGAIPSAVEDGVTGVTVAPSDPDALACAIASVLDRPAWAAELGRAARRRVEERFSVARTVEEYQSLYDSLLCRRSR